MELPKKLVSLLISIPIQLDCFCTCATQFFSTLWLAAVFLEKIKRIAWRIDVLGYVTRVDHPKDTILRSSSGPSSVRDGTHCKIWLRMFCSSPESELSKLSLDPQMKISNFSVELLSEFICIVTSDERGVFVFSVMRKKHDLIQKAEMN